MLRGSIIPGSLATAGNSDIFELRTSWKGSRRSSFSSSDSGISVGSQFSHESAASSATSCSSTSDGGKDEWETGTADQDCFNEVLQYAPFLNGSGEKDSSIKAFGGQKFDFGNPSQPCHDILPPPAHQIGAIHTRRTAPANPRRSTASVTWQKPSLVRETERREVLVEHLVDSATQFVSLIWPMAEADGTSRAYVIPLRIFIKETLKRSRTSYSTLQVTLYYLALVKSKNSVSPMLQCGRRMFLTALILASKYLQDRNFSSKAWSKISGLKSTEINANESAFLAAIDWQLHVKALCFEQWSHIVGKCTDLAKFGTSRFAWSVVVGTLNNKFCLDKMMLALMSSNFSAVHMAGSMPKPAFARSISVPAFQGPTVPGPFAEASSSPLPSYVFLDSSALSSVTTPAVGSDAWNTHIRSYRPSQSASMLGSIVEPGANTRPLTPPMTPREGPLTLQEPPFNTGTYPIRERPTMGNSWPTPALSSPATTEASLSFNDCLQGDVVSKTQRYARSIVPAPGRSSSYPGVATTTQNVEWRASGCVASPASSQSRGAKRNLTDLSDDAGSMMACKRTCSLSRQ